MAKKARRVRRTPNTMAAQYQVIERIVGPRVRMSRMMEAALLHQAEIGPFSQDEVMSHASNLMRQNSKKQADELDEMVEDLTDESKTKDLRKRLEKRTPWNSDRWGVLVTYIDGSQSGFPIGELGDLADIVERGPDWNLIRNISIQLIRRDPIGDLEGPKVISLDEAISLEEYSAEQARDED